MDPKAVTLVHHDWPIANKIVFYLVHTLGAWVVLGCIAVGALVILSILFKDKIRDTVGGVLDGLDKFINRK